ncbi:MAG: hybrid sensor histidine kinase/response regulator [Rhodanobacter sp. 68-29]|nr:Hpt domain-containing protein [Rhodanobacter sp.]ODV28065.1 MAG: hybrid sensor histidine kinase/response regulator [Rhodanobacter sp. SCN 68-63]OJY55863.1 MAG: hybrid sensor histidine kinase/response regulator [Rhodanobacter sp. 68-29]
MRLQDNIDFTTLQWVRPELEQTLSDARESLESYVDNPARPDAMRACASALHQVQGTLRMVELPGPAMVAAEMEALADALLEGQVMQREEAYSALMRGLMQLPDYLERVAGGHRDVPVVLLPLLNELRAARGEDALPEAALFHPNLDAFLPTHAPAAMSEAQAAARRGELVDLRLQFQQHMLAWFRGQPQALAGMRKALLAIAARCYHVHGRRLWWITAGVVEGIEHGILGAHGTELRQLLGKADRHIRQLIEHGEDSLRGGDADELCDRLLYIVAQSRQHSPHMDLLRRTYHLDSLLPDADELEHARSSMAGHNRALLDSVARALKDDLLRVKEALDLFQRQPDADPASLAPQGELLGRVGDTLGMLALSVPRRVVDEQRRVLDEIVNRMRHADEDTLLDVAGALLYVEASLDDHIESLGAGEEPREAEGAPGLPRSEAQGILSTVMQEAIRNTGKVKEAIVGFVESGWDHAGLADAPAQMGEVAGAARMLSAERPAELAEGIGRYIHNELLVDRRVPSSAQMDHLADALAALEYYLEAAREHRGGLAHIIDVAEHSLGKLGYWPLPDQRPLPVAPADATAPAGHADEALSEPVSLYSGSDVSELFVAPEAPHAAPAHDVDGLRYAQTEPTAPPAMADAGGDDGDWIEVEEEVEEPASAQGAHGGAFLFDHQAEGIDDDIREIFLEEMQEEIDHLRGAEGAWLADPAQLDALTPIRRSFHTLKGSGRLVGIAALGEFAWKVEDMLNRVLDHTIEPHAGVQALVHHAIAALPQLLASLKGEGAPHAPVEAIMQTASRLAAGDAAARVEDHAPVATETVRRIVRRRVPRLDAAAAAIPAAGITDAHSVPAAEPAEPPASLPLSPLPSVDPVLLEILRSEVAQYLQVIRTAIQRCSGELPVGEDLLRAVHTLHGAIAMVEIPLLTGLLSPLESLLKRVRHAGQPLPVEGVRLLDRSADVVDHTMAQFDVAVPQLPNVDLLTTQLIDLRDRYPEPQVAHVGAELHAEVPHAPAEPAGQAPDAPPAAATDDQAATLPAEPSIPATPPEEGSHDHYASELMAALGAFEPDTAAKEQREAAERAEAERVEAERAEAERAEAERVEAERVEAERIEAERVEAERAEAERAEAERVVAERAEAERSAHEQAERQAAERAAAEQAEKERQELARAEQARLAQEQAAREAAEAQIRAAAEKAAAEQRAAEAAAAEQARQAAEREAEAARQAAFEAARAVPAAGAAPTDTGLAIDADLLEVFVEEAREILDHADGVLAQWHAEPAASGHLPELQRDLHTLKGGARIAGLMPIGDLSHAIETLLEKPATDVAQTVPLIGVLETSFDQLHAMVQQVAQGQAPAYPQSTIDHLLALAGEQHFADEAELAPHAAPAVQPAAAAALPGLLPAQHDADAAAAQEQIRVRSELLDNLVNHAGEVAIYRSRLEQQVSAYRFNLVELDQTVQRLRSQLRMLEIETEAQIIARFQREHREAGSTTAFDPLELDRFSQLQQYSRALAESVSDLVSIQGTLDDLTRQAETLLIQQSRVSTELQDGLLRTRMLPFDTMVPNLRRTLRQAAQEQGKQAQLHVDGAHGEMDRNLLDRIKAPFEHMLRNAVAHGIESPDERRKAGKPAEGAVRIRVAREATEVVVRVADDGRGLDREAIRQRGVERGLIRADANLGDEQVLALITQPGFSTASEVTQLAGRGVGMDVVANEIKQLGGSLAIESQPGQGTTFVLRLPFTLAVTQAILVRIGENTFAIPMTSVQGVARISPDELTAKLAEHEPAFAYSGEQYGIHDLAELLGLPPGAVPEGEQPPLLLTRAGDLRAAIRIDAVLGSREIVVKSVGPQVSSVPGVLGATIMGDGSVLMILDLAPLVRHGVVRREARLAEGLGAISLPVVEEQRTKPLVMVVDDSITMRKITGRVLERHEYEVSTAKDGVDALEKLHERVPDLMLLDIEMPRMDGYELATQMKADPRLCDVPIIMITSRTGEKHRQRAFDIGVDRYLGKPYQEAELLGQIGEVLEQRAMAQLTTEPHHG